jgi:hypothetical protein
MGTAVVTTSCYMRLTFAVCTGRVLYANDNQLSGSPVNVATPLAQLQTLVLANNSFSGTLPGNFPQLFPAIRCVSVRARLRVPNDKLAAVASRT